MSAQMANVTNLCVKVLDSENKEWWQQWLMWPIYVQKSLGEWEQGMVADVTNLCTEESWAVRTKNGGWCDQSMHRRVLGSENKEWWHQWLMWPIYVWKSLGKWEQGMVAAVADVAFFKFPAQLSCVPSCFRLSLHIWQLHTTLSLSCTRYSRQLGWCRKILWRPSVYL